MKLVGLKISNRQDKIIHENDLKFKHLHMCFHKKKDKLPCEQRWERIFGKELPWRNIWRLIRLSKASPLAKQLHFKILHNTIFTENKLWIMKCSDGICRCCKEDTETIEHLFWACPNAFKVWEIILPIIETLTINLYETDICNPQSYVLHGMYSKPQKSMIHY